MTELSGKPALASTLRNPVILVNSPALPAPRYYAFRKAYNVVPIQPLRVQRRSRRRLSTLTILASAVVGTALIPARTVIVSSFRSRLLTYRVLGERAALGA